MFWSHTTPFIKPQAMIWARCPYLSLMIGRIFSVIRSGVVISLNLFKKPVSPNFFCQFFRINRFAHKNESCLLKVILVPHTCPEDLQEGMGRWPSEARSFSGYKAPSSSFSGFFFKTPRMTNCLNALYSSFGNRKMPNRSNL